MVRMVRSLADRTFQLWVMQPRAVRRCALAAEARLARPRDGVDDLRRRVDLSAVLLGPVDHIKEVEYKPDHTCLPFSVKFGKFEDLFFANLANISAYLGYYLRNVLNFLKIFAKFR